MSHPNQLCEKESFHNVLQQKDIIAIIWLIVATGDPDESCKLWRPPDPSWCATVRNSLQGFYKEWYDEYISLYKIIKSWAYKDNEESPPLSNVVVQLLQISISAALKPLVGGEACPERRTFSSAAPAQTSFLTIRHRVRQSHHSFHH